MFEGAEKKNISHEIIKILEFARECFECKKQEVLVEFIQHETVPLLIQLVNKYSFNNVLHFQVFKIFSIIISEYTTFLQPYGEFLEKEGFITFL